MKATKVDGIYAADPMTDASALKYDHISYAEVLEKNLKVMDATAISLAKDHNMPMVVFNMTTPGNIKSVILGEPIGTTVGGPERA